MPSSPILEIRGLHKNFGRKGILKGVSLSLFAGDRVVILGAKNSGKSTLLKIILNLIFPSSGQILLFGNKHSHHTLRREVGYLPQDLNFPANITAQEYLRLCGELSGISFGVLREEIPATLHLLKLENYRYKDINSLPKNIKRRLALAQAILHKPSLLLADEISSNCPPEEMELFKRAVKEQIGGSGAILYTSNVVGEEERRCDYFLLLRRGRIEVQKHINKVLAGIKFYRLRVEGGDKKLDKKLEELGGVEKTGDGDFRLRILQKRSPDDIKKMVSSCGGKVMEMVEEPPSPQELFREIMREKEGGGK